MPVFLCQRRITPMPDTKSEIGVGHGLYTTSRDFYWCLSTPLSAVFTFQ